MVAFHTVAFGSNKIPAVYDPAQGKYIEQPQQITRKSCYVYDLSTTQKLEMYGRLDVRGLVIYHLGKLVPDATTAEVLTGPFQGKYYINSRRQVSGKASYIVSEVVSNGTNSRQR